MMRPLIFRVVLTSLVVITAPTAMAEAPSEQLFTDGVQAKIEEVCGFCHYYQFLDDETGTLDRQKFLSFRPEILRRLQLEAGAEDRMPPATSPLQIDDETRNRIVQVLKSFNER
jgi:hypothetical protein